MTSNRRRLAALTMGLLGVSALHFATATQGLGALALHVFFRKLYALPIFAGALWFGWPGAAGTAAAATGLYALHLWRDWSPGAPEWIDQAGEMASFLVLASASAVLVGWERRTREAAVRAQRRAHQERIGTAVAALTETLGAKDPETRDHSSRTATLAEGFASHLGLPIHVVRSLYLAGIVHDIGKIGIRDDVLQKPEALTDEERTRLREHPRIAERILAPIGFHQVVRYAASHHENVDGTGYPLGLKGNEIPLPGRMLAIADTYDALRSNRPYKEALDEADVRRIMNGMAAKKLDRSLLREFWSYLDAVQSGNAQERNSAPISGFVRRG